MNPLVLAGGLAGAVLAAVMLALRPNGGVPAALDNAGNGLSDYLSSASDTSGGGGAAPAAGSPASNPATSSINGAFRSPGTVTATTYGPGVFPGTQSATATSAPGTPAGYLPGVGGFTVGQPTPIPQGGGVQGFHPAVNPQSFKV